MYLSHDEIETTSLSQQDLECIQLNLGNYFRDIKRFTTKEIEDLYFVNDFIKNISLQNIRNVKHKYYNVSDDETYNIVEIYLNKEVDLGYNNLKASNFILYLSDKLFRNKLEFDVYKLNFKGIKVFYEFDKKETIYLPLFERLGTYLHQMKPIFKHTSLEYWENKKKQAQYELDTINNIIKQTKEGLNNLKEK